jgi:HAT1-interacting factor 1
VVDDTQLSAPALAARALDRELSAGTSSGVPTVPGQTGLVNDLTGMVKKKKKPVDVGAAGTKRKADDDDAPSPTEKRARVEEVLDADA